MVNKANIIEEYQGEVWISRERAGDITELLRSCDELLGMARFMYWMYECHKDDDPSFREALSRAQAALERMEIKQISLDEFVKNIESMIDSGLTPDQWHAFNLEDAHKT